MKSDSTDLITIKGLVVPSRWDKYGNVIGIAIAGYNEMEFPVLMNRTGRGLTVLLHKKVIVRGRKIKSDNVDVIEVQKFTKDLI